MTRKIVAYGLFLPALAVAACVALGGCEDNLARRDAVTPWSGDDVAANEAIQTVNPWPRDSFNRRQVTQGSKLESAMQTYRTTTAQSVSAPSTTDAAPAAGAQPSPQPSTSGN